MADTFVYIISMKFSKLNFSEAYDLTSLYVSYRFFHTEFTELRFSVEHEYEDEFSKKASNVTKTSIAILKIHEVRCASERANGRASSYFDEH